MKVVVRKETQFEVTHKFDRQRCRHYFNKELTVLHCHHYAALYTRLAEDAEIFDGKKLLTDSAEHTFFKILQKYMVENGINELEDKIKIAEAYWAYVGMGSLKIIKAGESSGYVEMKRSHIDEGRIKKFGTNLTPVNHITRGYLAAVFSILFELPEKSYEVFEVASIVCGAKASRFKIVRQ
jgi:hypothetical protein